VFWLVNVVAVVGKRAAVETLARLPGVVAIESDRPFKVPLEQVQPDTPAATGIEWNIILVNAPQVWAHGATGEGIVYAVADTGVKWTHPALKPHYRGWNGTTADHNFNWWDAIHSGATNLCGFDSPIPCDDFGHGTHVTGTGIGDDGASHQIGMAPGAKWIACRNMDNGVGQPSTYIECLQFFIAPTDLQGNNPNPALHADVISNSYSCPASEGCSSSSLHDAIEHVRAAGIFMAVSAGNSGSSCASITDPPAVEPSVFTVGAVDQTKNIAGFSSRGPVLYGGISRMGPDITAPGVQVVSSLMGGGYGSMSGTSMAAPHVAGAVALLWSAYPELRGQVSETELILRGSAIQRTTTDVCGSDTANSWPNNVYGYGFLDAQAAFELVPQIHKIILPLIFR
jgi:subtilisin family serine protease